MICTKRLGVTLISVGAALAVQAGVALAGDWQPKRPLEIVVPSAPGGGQDLAARTLQSVVEKLKASPRPVVVTNKPGGGGTVAPSPISTPMPATATTRRSRRCR